MKTKFSSPEAVIGSSFSSILPEILFTLITVSDSVWFSPHTAVYCTHSSVSYNCPLTIYFGDMSISIGIELLSSFNGHIHIPLCGGTTLT